MIEKLFGGDRFLATTRALDAATLRHQVIANNLANANTPGFKRQEVTFESELARAITRSSEGCAPGCSPIAQVLPHVVTINTTSTRTDGNNVNLETENINLTTNTLKFEALSQSVGGYFTALKTVISGGR